MPDILSELRKVCPMRLLEDLRNETLTIPLKDLPRFIGQLAELTVMAHARLVSPPAPARADRLLDVAAAAQRMGVSKQFLYVNSKKFNFTRRVGRKLLFSSAGIDAFLKQKSR